MKKNQENIENLLIEGYSNADIEKITGIPKEKIKNQSATLLQSWKEEYLEGQEFQLLRSIKKAERIQQLYRDACKRTEDDPKLHLRYLSGLERSHKTYQQLIASLPARSAPSEKQAGPCRPTAEIDLSGVSDQTLEELVRLYRRQPGKSPQ